MGGGEREGGRERGVEAEKERGRWEGGYGEKEGGGERERRAGMGECVGD